MVEGPDGALMPVPTSTLMRQSRSRERLRSRSERNRDFDEEDEVNKSDGASNLGGLLAVKEAAGEKARKLEVAPVGAQGVSPAGAKLSVADAAAIGASPDIKDLLERIDRLETENAKLQEDKLELAKAVKSMNDVLKEAKKNEKIYQQQINDAERQGATILPVEAIEEKNKIALKKSKSKKKGRKRAAEVDSDNEDEDEPEVFANNEELKQMVNNLVPDESRDDTVEEAKRIMMIQNSKGDELEKEITRLSKENSLLQKSLVELKKRNDDEGGLTLDSLTEENKALIAQIKNLKKENQELKDQRLNTSQIRDTHVSRNESQPGLSKKGTQKDISKDASKDASKAEEESKGRDGDFESHMVNYEHTDDGPCPNCEKYKETIGELEDKVAILEEENIHIKSNLNKEEDRANKLDTDYNTLRLEYAQLASEKPSKGGKADGVLKKQLEDLMAENQNLKDYNKQLDAKTQPTKRLEVKLDKKDKEIEKLQNKIEQLQNRREAEGARDESPDKTSKKQSAAGGAAETRALKAKEKENAKLKSELEKLKDKVETLTITADARKEEIKSLHQINKDQEREIKTFKGDIASIEKSKDKSLSKLEKLKEKETSVAKAKEEELKKKMEKNKDKLSGDIEKLKKEMQDMMNDYENRLKIMKDQSVMLNGQLDESEQGIKERDKEIKELRKKMEEMGQRVGDAENLFAEHKELKKKLKELTNEFGVMEVKYKEEVKKRKKLHNQIEDMKGKIRVFARVRPMNKLEASKGSQNVVEIPDEMSIVVQTRNGPKKYNFDNCFGPDSTQEEVFEESCTLVQSAIDGFNV